MIVIQDYSTVTGGASQVANLECDALKAQGFEVERVGTDGRVGSIVRANIRLIFLLLVFRKRKVIIHTWSLFPSLTLGIFANPSRFCFVVHDYLLLCPSKALFNFTKGEYCSLKGGSTSCLKADCGYRPARKFLGALFGVVGRLLVRMGARVRYLSPLSQTLAKDYGLLGHSDLLSNLYVWDIEPQPVVNECVVEQKFVLFAGRWTNDKGADRFRKVRAEFVKVVAGVEGRSTDKCVYLGWVSPAEVKWLIKNAAAVVYPARQRDCDPLIVQECIALGIPIFVSSGNASASTVARVFGECAVIEDWHELGITSGLIEECRSTFSSQSGLIPSANQIVDYYDQN